MDWLNLLAVQGTLKSLLQQHSSKASILQCSSFFIVQLSYPYMTTGKTIALTRRTFVGKGISLLFFFNQFIIIIIIIILLCNIVLVLPHINMNLPWVYMFSQSRTSLPPPCQHHPSGSSQCTSPKHPAPCIEPRLAIRFLYDIIHVYMPFSQIIPSSPSSSPTESKRLFYTSVSLLLSLIQGYHCHLSKFPIYLLVYCIGVFLSGLLHSVCFIAFYFKRGISHFILSSQ